MLLLLAQLAQVEGRSSPPQVQSPKTRVTIFDAYYSPLCVGIQKKQLYKVLRVKGCFKVAACATDDISQTETETSLEPGEEKGNDRIVSFPDKYIVRKNKLIK